MEKHQQEEEEESLGRTDSTERSWQQILECAVRRKVRDQNAACSHVSEQVQDTVVEISLSLQFASHSHVHAQITAQRSHGIAKDLNMADVPQFRFGPRVARRDNAGLNYVSVFWRWLQVIILSVVLSSFYLIGNSQAVSGPGVVISLTETFTMIAAFCMFIYSLLLFYQGSIEYLSTRIQPHP